jgi:PBP1b-binding outer membrane lipoprotein LpoB
MKKLFFVFAVTAFFAACNNDTTSTEAPKDSTTTAPVDTAAKAVDTAAKAVDSVVTAAVDSVKK